MNNPPLENYIQIFTNLEYFFMFIGIVAGFKLISFLLNVLLSELQYNGGGDDYINFGKEYVYWFSKIAPVEIGVNSDCLTLYLWFHKWWLYN